MNEGNGWTLERRLRQAEAIRLWQPWMWATGPKSVTGKARAAQDALKHGARSQASIHLFRQCRELLRQTEASEG